MRIQRRRRKANGRRVIEWMMEISLTDSSVAWHCRRLQQPEKGKQISYTSWHDYLDAERASCLMNTHWNAVLSNRQSLNAFPLFLHSVVWPGPGFQVWGSNPSQDLFFAFFLAPNFLQRSINGEYFSNNFFNWLIGVVIGVTSQKVASTGVRTPDLENVEFELELKQPQHVACSTRSQTTL